MNTQDVLVFTTAVATGSLAGAARRLGLAPMVATRRLAALETELGVRLLHRTTRSLSLTAEGETFLPYAEALAESEREAVARLRAENGGAIGLLRVSAPIAFGTRFIAPIVPGLLAGNPELRIALDLVDSLPDLVATGTDLAIRIARLRDSGLIAQKLADNPRILVASPEYLARHGIPATAADLARHDCLVLGSATHWTFLPAPDTTTAERGEMHVRINARFSCTTIEGCRTACLAGGGVTLLSVWNVAEDLAAGRLQEIDLSGIRPEPINVWAVYPTTKLLPQKVRIFIATLRAELARAGLEGVRA